MNQWEPAYPEHLVFDPDYGARGRTTSGHPGMTLRDYIAVAAMPIALEFIDRDEEHANAHELAINAYAIADAMIEERKV